MLPSIQTIKIFSFAVGMLFFALIPFFALAQFNFGQTGYTLQSNPTYPAPESEYTMSIVGPTFDMSRGAISWTVDGGAQPDVQNQQSITLRAGALGKAARVTANFTAAGAPTTLESVVIPSAVDIVVEASTIVPSFYKGRRLPSEGSTIRLVAIPHLYTVSGTYIAPNDLLFRWSLNDRVISEGRGKSTLVTDMPRTGDATFALVVENVGGTVAHRSGLTIEPAESFVRFYEENPLYGLARTAIGSTLYLEGEEVTIKAEPYFVSSDILSNAQYGWTLDQESVDNSGNPPQSLTLRKIGEGGEAEVGFSIRNLNSLLQYATGLFTIDFRDSAQTP